MERRTRRTPLAALATTLMAAVLLLAVLPGQAAQEFDPDSILKDKALEAELRKLQSDSDAQQALTTHAQSAFGVTSTIFDFAAKLASGDYVEQIEKIMDVPVQQWNPNLGWMGGYDIKIVKRICAKNQTASLFGRVKDDMGNLGTALSVYSVMKDVYAGYNGDNAARLKAMKGTYDLCQGYWAQRMGWNSIGTAMMGAAVIGYALDTFQAEAQQRYTDYWYNAYSQWLEGEYPNIVTGPDSWADLARTGGKTAVQRRLYAFWDAPYDNAVKYYGQDKLQTAPAMADLQMRDRFAAQYYYDRIHTTLKTYFTNETEKAEAMAAYEAEKAHERLMQRIAELQMLQKAIQDAEDAKTGEEEEEAPTPISLLLRPGSTTLDIGESVTFTAWYIFEDHTLKPATANLTYGGAASGSTFTAAEAGDFTITATCDGLSASATVKVNEQEGEDDEEDEIDDAIDEIQDPEDEDLCEAAGIAEMRSSLAGLVARVQSKASVVGMYRTKFDKELADRAADPCGNTLMAYCYQQASLAAGDIDYLVDELRSLASSLLMQMALCPDDVAASGEPYTIRDVIKDIADAGRARGDAEAALTAMQSRLGEAGCDEDEFTELGDRYVEDGEDPDGLQDGGNMNEIAGDGVDNDQDGLQEEDWSEVAGKTVTIVVYDSGNLKDDVFSLSVSGVGNLGLTPAGGLRTFGLDLSPGTYTASVTVIVAPDNCGTVTAVAMQNGVEIGALGSGESCPAVGSVLSFTFTVTAPE